MNRVQNNSKILLVDDDVKNLQVAMSILKEYNVIYAQSGQKALELLETNSFDLILLDVVMPNLDGYEVCEQIKNSDKFKNIPIIFLTVKDDKKDIVKGFEYGAVDYITKPFFSEVLLKRVELHLSLSHALKDLKDMNTNLNKLVNEQVEELRKKEQILFQQSKVTAMSEMIDAISREWNQPLNIIKLYLQSLFLQLNVNEVDIDESKKMLEKTIEEVTKLDDTMQNFQKFFKNDIEKQSVNIKVLLDSVVFLFKDQINKQKIDVSINGSNLINFDFIYDEVKHVFMKLLSFSLEHFGNITKKENFINFNIDEDKDSIYIKYKDNCSLGDDKCISEEFNKNLSPDKFDLGFYLMSIFIEKNGGFLDVFKNSEGVCLSIRFDK